MGVGMKLPICILCLYLRGSPTVALGLSNIYSGYWLINTLI